MPGWSAATVGEEAGCDVTRGASMEPTLVGGNPENRADQVSLISVMCVHAVGPPPRREARIPKVINSCARERKYEE